MPIIITNDRIHNKITTKLKLKNEFKHNFTLAMQEKRTIYRIVILQGKQSNTVKLFPGNIDN